MLDGWVSQVTSTTEVVVDSTIFLTNVLQIVVMTTKVPTTVTD